MTPAQRVAAVLAAAALAVPVIATHEGYVPVGYRDPAPGKFETICYGHMQAGVFGKRYTADQCAELLASDAVTHGLEISKCLPEGIPAKTLGAFVSFAFNVGSDKFCKSTLAAKARAGDLKGACAELSRWTFAGGKQLPGLVKRRAAERQMCEAGL